MLNLVQTGLVQAKLKELLLQIGLVQAMLKGFLPSMLNLVQTGLVQTMQKAALRHHQAVLLTQKNNHPAELGVHLMLHEKQHWLMPRVDCSHLNVRHQD